MSFTHHNSDGNDLEEVDSFDHESHFEPEDVGLEQRSNRAALERFVSGSRQPTSTSV